jgi:hypothetical protein
VVYSPSGGNAAKPGMDGNSARLILAEPIRQFSFYVQLPGLFCLAAYEDYPPQSKSRSSAGGSC